MKQKSLLGLVLENGISCLAIIGLAKNSGKTVTLNALIREAVKEEVKLSVASYGRDGEDIDAITLKEKPPIFIPPDTCFVTAEQLFEKSRLQAEIVADTGLDTPLGRVKIYRSGDSGDSIELAGVNRASRMVMIKDLLPESTELFLIDGAMDRRSSAIPSLAHGTVLATGAVIGNTVDLIVQRTMAEVERITLPPCSEREISMIAGGILRTGNSALIRDRVTIAMGNGVFGGLSTPDWYHMRSGDYLVLNGALTDTFAESLILEYEAESCTIIVRDGTRVFLNNRNMKLLKKKSVSLQVHEPIALIAVTVNPYSPYGFRVDSDLLVETMKGSLRDAGMETPVFDVLSKDYL
ncbi:MAG: hypothetical protein KOO61_09595 [Spirochaetales bacterium]|nr:hypothetical protein [Spirochaetales bacterium]